MSRQSPPDRDPWYTLKRLTSARIALGRSGGSLPTQEWLNFKLSHARAKDAVRCAFDTSRMEKAIREVGIETLVVDSNAGDRMTYLQRPDLGRRLSEPSQAILGDAKRPCDLVVIVSDGLSATAVHAQTTRLLSVLLPKLKQHAWTLAPVIIARLGRVALQDEIGALIGAKIAVMLIGERPGLGSPDSLGAYVVCNPRLGNTDANRNCVSNIRPEGLDPREAADAIYYLLTESRRLKVSGVSLKDKRLLPAKKPHSEPLHLADDTD